MAEKYDDGYNSSDFKRNSTKEQEPDSEPQNGEEGPKLNEKAGEYMRELLSEKVKLNNAKFPISSLLIDQELTKVQASGRVPPKDNRYLDVHRDKPTKVTVKVLVPVKEFPKFNFVGKLLGPKGNTMKSLQEETMCKMAILGRGSMRDRQKEEELRNSLDPKYAHLMEDLHVEISALATPTEAHARITYALAEIKKYLTPDPADVMWPPVPRHEIERDVQAERRPLLANPPPPPHKSVLYSACTVTRRSLTYRDPVIDNVNHEGEDVFPGPPLRGHPPPRGPPVGMSHASHESHRPMPAKNKVISILDRARSALESSYPYEDPYSAVPEPPIRGAGRGISESEAYYERGNDRFYDEEPSYYKEEPREYKSVRDVGSRRSQPSHGTRQYSAPRSSPYGRPPKQSSKKRPL